VKVNFLNFEKLLPAKINALKGKVITKQHRLPPK